MQRVELFQTLIRIFGLSDMTEDLESASRKSAGQDRPTSQKMAGRKAQRP
jgi:hypothetical protein